MSAPVVLNRVPEKQPVRSRAKRMRAGSDQAHLPQEHVPELWKLEAGAAQHSSDACDAVVLPGRRAVPAAVEPVRSHGPQLVADITPVISADPLLQEEGRTG